MLNEMTNLDRPICFFDIQTTGLSFKNDRIIELYIKRINPDKTFDEFHKLINPGEVEISEEAEKIHGINKDMLKDKPLFKEIAKDVEDFLGDYHLGGYYIMRFDLPFLMEELYRHGIMFNYKKNNRKIIDAKNVFTSTLNPNSIEFAYKYFTGNDITNEEKSAKKNVDYSIEILEKNIEILPNKDLDSINEKSQINDFFDLSGKIIKKDKDFILNFGKYNGKSVFELFNLDVGYYKWLMGSESISIDTKYVLKMLYNYWIKLSNK